jgi:hypothetical protein
MNARHVQARLDKRGANRCRVSCPGWVVRTNPGKPKLMACAACNALHPARLQITDQMVKLLPIARDGLRAVSNQLRRARVERATTHHIQGPDFNVDGAFATLCGHELGRTLRGRRTHVRALIATSATCGECIRLDAMTQDERDAERQAISYALRVKFADKCEQAVRERQARNTATEAAIEVARDEALVAMDIMLEVDFDRVKLVINVIATSDACPAPDKDPTLVARAEARVMLVENALKMAVVAHRHANPKSRGERRWLFRNVQGTTDGRGRCDVACRFCDKMLMEWCTIGDDYTIATDDHTVRCALEYLGGKMPDNPSDDVLELAERHLDEGQRDD